MVMRNYLVITLGLSWYMILEDVRPDQKAL